MPARRRRRNVRKRRARRRRTLPKRNRRVNRHSAYAGSILPSKKNFTFKYVDSIEGLSIIGSPIASHSFRANSLFDPDFTGAGHQPLGFDQIKTMYEEFHVIGCKIKATLYSATTNGDALLFFIIPSAANNINANFLIASDIMEYPAARWTIIKAGDTDGYDRNIPKTITHQMNVPKFLGKRGGYLASAVDKCTASANPTEQCAFIVGIASMNNLTNAQSISFSTEIEYIAIAHEPQIILAS